MKKILIATCIFLSVQPVYALLSPINQSITEIRAMINNPEFTQLLPQTETIRDIYKVENGYYILTNNYQQFVEIQYAEQNRPGPKQFKLVFHAPNKIN